MAESMRGLRRSHRCTEVSSANIGEKVTVMGWVQRRRNLGSLIFIDLRDRSGLLQIVFDEGRVYVVDQVRDVCRRAADVGGVGDRYTCVIQGQERYLWFEKGRWFVEAFSE